MSTELLDLDRLRAQPLLRDPFPFVVVSGMLKPGTIRDISRDFPAIGDGGVYPVSVLPLGPAMRKLVAEISGPDSGRRKSPMRARYPRRASGIHSGGPFSSPESIVRRNSSTP